MQNKGKPYNQTAFSQCGVNDRAYYEGFISGCVVGQGIEYFACNQIAKYLSEKNKQLYSTLNLFLLFKSILGCESRL